MNVKPERYNEYQKDTMTGMKSPFQKALDRKGKSIKKRKHA